MSPSPENKAHQVKGDVQPVTGWRERVDPAVAEAVGDGEGPLPIRLHPDEPPGPGIEVHWMHGSVLVVGIYPTADEGVVYRFDHGVREWPTVIHWQSPETAPPDWPDCESA